MERLDAEMALNKNKFKVFLRVSTLLHDYSKMHQTLKMFIK